MKKVNREGPAVMGTLPKPEKVSITDITRQNGLIIDTREAEHYMNGHLDGSLLATLDGNFNTIVGSYANADEDLYLIIDEQHLDEAIRDLVRVGLDNIKGYATPQMLSNWDHDLATIDTIDFDAAEKLRTDNGVRVLDVRKATEFAEGNIPGAINIAHTRLADELDQLPKENELLVHCAGGQRASYASGLLAQNGYRIKWIDDDFSKWEKKYGDTATTAASR